MRAGNVLIFFLFLFPASLDFLLIPTDLSLLSVEMFERRESKHAVKVRDR